MSIDAIPDRIFNRILFEPNTGCWLWTGAKAATRYRGGYGHGYLGGRHDYTHRYIYTLLVGPIPASLELDHLCRIPACCNPAHLEAVTHQENIRRGHAARPNSHRVTHCPHGHAYEGGNLVPTRTGKFDCRTCHRARDARRRALRRQQAA